MTWAIATGIAIGAVVGGGSAALQHKDILKGALLGGATGAVTGGIGSLAGAGASAGADLMAEGALTGTDALISGEAAQGINALNPGTQIPTSPEFWGDTPMPENMPSSVSPNFQAPYQGTQGFKAPTQPFGLDTVKNYVADNKMSIGLAGLAGGMAPNASQPAGPDMGTIRPYTYSAGLNPGYTGAGTPYFNQHYTAGTPYAAAEGGIMSLASGGSAVSDYNKMLMSRAQDEYINSPQLGAFRSHFNDPIANADSTNALYQKYLGRPADPTGIAANQRATPEEIARNIQSSPEYLTAHPGATAPAAPTGPIAFDPVSRRYINMPAAPTSAASTGIAALPQQTTGDNQVGGGAANGGLMRYAMGGGIGSYYPAPDDGQGGQHPQDTMMGAHPSVSMGPSYPMQGIKSEYAGGGGISDLGGYSDGGRLLKGPGDGVSDDIPAQIGANQPARLADGEFVIPARIVSELGNGSTDAGAKRLYAMMDRVQANRKKTVGKGKVAVNSKSDKYLPA
jgi:hypothetical protein